MDTKPAIFTYITLERINVTASKEYGNEEYYNYNGYPR